MQSIVNSALDFSKPVDLKLKLEDLRNTVRRACDSCRVKAKEARVPLVFEPTQEALPAEIDSAHLERAIVNLVNNAIDASDRGKEVNVRVSLSPDKNLLVVRIKDQGEGMDKETIEKIFIPFYTKKVPAPVSECR